MALTVPVEMSVTIVDEWGIDASAPYYAMVDPASTIGQVEAFLAQLVTSIDAASDGQITKNRLTLFPALPSGIKSSPAVGSRVEQTGLLGFNSVGATVGSATTKRFSETIPALSNGNTVLVGDRMVLTAADPIANLILLLTTISTILVWCNNHSQQLTQFKDALVAFRKKRRQLQRSSFEV